MKKEGIQSVYSGFPGSQGTQSAGMQKKKRKNKTGTKTMLISWLFQQIWFETFAFDLNLPAHCSWHLEDLEEL